MPAFHSSVCRFFMLAPYVRFRTSGGPVGATLSLAGVLVGGIGGFVVATTYDLENSVERKVGVSIGVLLMVVGVGLFIAGWV
jgi:hypothetical protein